MNLRIGEKNCGADAREEGTAAMDNTATEALYGLPAQQAAGEGRDGLLKKGNLCHRNGMRIPK